MQKHTTIPQIPEAFLQVSDKASAKVGLLTPVGENDKHEWVLGISTLDMPEEPITKKQFEAKVKAWVRITKAKLLGIYELEPFQRDDLIENPNRRSHIAIVSWDCEPWNLLEDFE